MRRFLITLFVMFVLFSCSTPDDGSAKMPMATAEVWSIRQQPDSSYVVGSLQVGSLQAFQMDGFLRLEIIVEGLTPNYRHAVHLHMGTCENPSHHWNQGSNENYCEVLNLGEVWARPKAGDVGNVNTDASGSGTLVVDSELWSIGTGHSSDILGSVVVVHGDPENFDRECFENHTHTHANPKIACGVIVAQ